MILRPWAGINQGEKCHLTQLYPVNPSPRVKRLRLLNLLHHLILKIPQHQSALTNPWNRANLKTPSPQAVLTHQVQQLRAGGAQG